MRIGTFSCWLFGHKFRGRGLVYDPHYLELAKRGLASGLLTSDYHYSEYRTDNCVRCGIKDDNK